MPDHPPIHVPMVPVLDDVRKTVAEFLEDYTPGSRVHDLARLADAVLNPTETVRQAIRERYQHPHEALDNHCNAIIADWIVGILPPAAKETTKA